LGSTPTGARFKQESTVPAVKESSVLISMGLDAPMNNINPKYAGILMIILGLG
jgi:hypothetical protein